MRQKETEAGITQQKEKGDRLNEFHPVQMVVCEETGSEVVDDDYECHFFTDQDVDGRDKSGAFRIAPVSNMHYSDLELERFNDRQHSLTRGSNPVHVAVFDEDAGCFYNEGSHSLQCQPMDDAIEQYESSVERRSRF